jgi:hypothetical protein
MLRAVIVAASLTLAVSTAWAAGPPDAGADSKLIIRVVPTRRPLAVLARSFEVNRAQPRAVTVLRHGTLRSAPQSDSPTLALLIPGDQVVLTGIVSGGQWLEVDRDGRRGYTGTSAFDDDTVTQQQPAQAAPKPADVATEDAVWAVLSHVMVLQAPPVPPQQVPAHSDAAAEPATPTPTTPTPASQPAAPVSAGQVPPSATGDHDAVRPTHP